MAKDDAKPAGRGRKPLASRGQASTAVNVRMAPATYNAAFQRSRQGRCSVPTVVRRALAKYLDDEDADD